MLFDRAIPNVGLTTLLVRIRLPPTQLPPRWLSQRPPMCLGPVMAAGAFLLSELIVRGQRVEPLRTQQGIAGLEEVKQFRPE
jgi:hypothetical protein